MLEIGEVLVTVAKIFEFGQDLSKAFDCISQAIITAKFNAYVMLLPCLFLTSKTITLQIGNKEPKLTMHLAPGSYNLPGTLRFYTRPYFI